MDNQEIVPKKPPPGMERLRVAYWRSGVIMSVVYKVRDDVTPPELDFWGAWCPYFQKQESYADAGERYRPMASDCLRRSRDRVAAPDPRFCPDESGKLPWTVCISSGPIREAGFVICALIIALDEAEATMKAAMLQTVFSGDKT